VAKERLVGKHRKNLTTTKTISSAHYSRTRKVKLQRRTTERKKIKRTYNAEVRRGFGTLIQNIRNALRTGH